MMSGGIVPLSEEEMRLLEQMERALSEEDPKLAHTLRGTSFQRTARKRAVISGVVFLVGVVLLMTGAVAAQAVVGVIGFVVMLVSATMLVTSLRTPPAPEASPFRETPQGFGVVEGGRKTRRPKSGRTRAGRDSGSSLVERMEERWRRRRDTGGY